MKFKIYFFLTFVLFFCFSCSIDRWAVNRVADMLGDDSGGNVFTSDDDPELVGEALPFAIKLYESILEGTPEHQKLLLAAGKAYCLYAFAYIQGPAELLPVEEYDEKEYQLERAKKMFFRARNLILRALDLRRPGFKELIDRGDFAGALELIRAADVPWLHWLAASWMGAFSTDTFNVELSVALPGIVSLVEKVIVLDGSYESGAPFELLVAYYGGFPAEGGGSIEKARLYYEKALEFSGGMKGSVYLALATSVSVAAQDLKEFRELCEKVLALDVKAAPDWKLLNVLAQKKAKHLLDDVGEFFFIEDISAYEEAVE